VVICARIYTVIYVHRLYALFTSAATTGTFPRGLRDEVMEWVMANHDELIKEWKKWHP